MLHGRLKKKTPAALEAARAAKVAARVKAYRACVAKAMESRQAGSNDEAALETVTRALEMNSDLYSLWNYRREMLMARMADGRAEPADTAAVELAFTARCLRSNPKSYWLWHHRVWVMEMDGYTPDFAEELRLCGLMLDADDRNFHCWNYRRYIAGTAAVPDADELDYTLDRINANFSNYSAWHYRSHLLPRIHGPDFAASDSSFATTEFELVQSAFYTEPDDQSAWLYHRWLLGRSAAPPRLTAVIALPGPAPILALVFSVPVAGVAPTNVTVAPLPPTSPPLRWRPAHSGRLAGGLSPVWLATLDASPATLSVAVNTGPGIAAKDGSPLIDGVAMNAELELPGPATVVLELDAQLAAAAAARSDLLARELAACDELLDLEPDAKWALLTKAFILEALDPASPVLDTLYTCLLDVDPYRAGFYRDALSRRTLDAALADHDSASLSFALPAAGLVALGPRTHALASATALDFSGNPLRCLAGAEAFVSATALDLSSCGLRELGTHLADLPVLASLNLANNALHPDPAVAFAGLAGSPLAASLTALDLSGNDGYDTPAAAVAVAAIFPRLAH
ncbi:geranylgeranyl transferase type-2 subunit alpha [Thecamonas trahens ATCC 50062]|uniref:Geranylgeranyl transferase type-2 subunit alpha n=1 Tax=Thecamonas trahens ATCC 50062 TaxID=461836 RepID=A0A0L0DQZ4_THETB|nr:geranylgeranyl transferase type-2 subunit alpha [Thecamonas trahens ATCC 50062]KNC54436.1 geranylgeranyl transferase type-2 subunit alpha [Thecamonas trahens ATCC 50062]|eukprot:XP_013753729.1 geranylgeranyl transferase type-2 subunit alpha [Thecamonas trahens ATCC 50062]